MIRCVEWMSTTFCTWSVVLVETNSNLVCLGEEVDDLMEIDGIKSNLAWQEIEVDNLMEVDEKVDHHLGEKVDLMDVDEVVD